MAVGEKLKRLFVTDEDDKKVSRAAATPVASAPNAPMPASGPTYAAASAPIYAPLPSPSVDPDMRAAMLDVVRKAVFNRAGPTAYTKLTDAAEKMRKAIADEDTRLRAAIATTGVTLVEIKDALGKHRQGLHEARSQFLGEAAQQRRTKIDAKKERQTAGAAELQSLRARVAQLESEATSLAGQLAAHEAIFARSDLANQAAIAEVEAELSANGRKIETLIQEVA